CGVGIWIFLDGAERSKIALCRPSQAKSFMCTFVSGRCVSFGSVNLSRLNARILPLHLGEIHANHAIRFSDARGIASAYGSALACTRAAAQLARRQEPAYWRR